MYNLKNLNDYEFEILCHDMMEKVLQKNLYRFPRGTDGGIDLCDNIVMPQTILQMKHYSDFNNLKNNIKNIELEKIKKLNCKNYYLCTSLELNRERKLELYNILNPYMSSIDNIIDGIIINDFLEDSSNIEIVRKNYKLWLNATNVLELLNNQNIFIDCEELVEEIKTKSQYYVETELYRKALNRIKKENIIIVLGAPGVGKSTISKMILLKYVSDGFKVRYATDNNISYIKRSVSINPEEKEIILLDDFLGQHYLNLKETTPNEIKSLLSFIRRHKNKKLILNSRITILNEAQSRSYVFNDLIEEYDYNKCIINVDGLSIFEKGKIFYNHIYFNKLPKTKFESLKKDKKYLNILNHRNYNPRIIEHVTRRNRYSNIKDEVYYDYVMENLNNPQDVWKDEFENRLTNIDREFMYILYSLTNTYIDKDVLEEAYNEKIKTLNLDMTLNTFEKTLRRLSDSLIKKIVEHGKIKISVENPSINDYIKNELEENNMLLMSIAENAIYVEQILKFKQNTDIIEKIKRLIKTGAFLKLKCQEKSIFYYYMECICKYDIDDKEIEEAIKLSLERCYENIKNDQDRLEYNYLIRRFFNRDNIVEDFNLKNILINPLKMKFLLEKMDSETLSDIYEVWKSNFKEDEYKDVLEIWKKRMLDELKKDMETSLEVTVNDIVDKNIETQKIFNNNLEAETIYSSSINEIEREVEVAIEELIALSEGDLNLNKENFDVEEILEDLGIWEIIDITLDFFDAEEDEDEEITSFDAEKVEDIFERYYEEDN